MISWHISSYKSKQDSIDWNLCQQQENELHLALFHSKPAYKAAVKDIFAGGVRNG